MYRRGACLVGSRGAGRRHRTQSGRTAASQGCFKSANTTTRLQGTLSAMRCWRWATLLATTRRYTAAAAGDGLFESSVGSDDAKHDQAARSGGAALHTGCVRASPNRCHTRRIHRARGDSFGWVKSSRPSATEHNVVCVVWPVCSFANVSPATAALYPDGGARVEQRTEQWHGSKSCDSTSTL